MEHKGKKRVSVVIPCRNEEKYIGQCIEAIVNQSYGIENIEVMVCDGCSEDNTQNIIKEYSNRYPQVKLIINEKKVAPTAMNLGIKRALGDIIIIFGSHAYMDVDYVKNSVEKLEETGAACVGGRIINISENPKAEAISLAMGSPFGVGNALFRYSDKEMFVDTVAFGAYKREIFNKVGYFDEELVRNQDDEFNFRVVQSGEKIYLTPSIISHYYTRGSFSKLWRQYYQYGFWKIRVIQKHKKPAAIRHLIPVTFVSTIIVGAILSLFSKTIGYLLSIELSMYFIGALIFSLKACKNKKKYIPEVMISFFILHTSYGLGFLEGFMMFYIFKNNKSLEKNTKTSR